MRYATKDRYLPGGGKLWAVGASRNGTYLVVGVNGGYLYKSSDSGATWTTLTSAPYTTYKYICVSDDGQYIFAAPYTDYVYVSSNGGTSFTHKTSVTSDNDGLAMSSTGQYGYFASFNVGSGYVYVTSDFGANWTAKTATTTTVKHVMSCSSNGQYVVTANNSGAVYTSADFGANWTLRTNAGNRQWFGGNISDDGTKLALAVYNVGIFTSTDSGANWTQRASAKLWQQLKGSGDGSKLLAMGDNTSNNNLTEFWTSSDSGVNWTQRSPGNLQDQYGQHSSGNIGSDGSGNFYISVQAQFLKVSTDNGANWSTLDTNYDFNKAMDRVVVSGDGKVGFAVEFTASGIHKSVDGLQSWSYIPLARRRVFATSYDGSKVLGAISTATTYTGTGADYPSVSTDTGANFTDMTGATLGEYYKGCMSYDGSTMYLTRQGFLHRSQNTGSTWTQLSQTTAGYWSGIACSSDGSKVYVTDGNPGYIYTSTNSGTGFTQRTGPGSRSWESIACSADGSIVYAVADSTLMYKSVDSGVNWSTLATSASIYWTQVLCSADGNRIIASYDDGVGSMIITCSFNGGSTWTTLYTLVTNNEYLFGSLGANASLRKIAYGVTSIRSGDLVEGKLTFMI